MPGIELLSGQPELCPCRSHDGALIWPAKNFSLSHSQDGKQWKTEKHEGKAEQSQQLLIAEVLPGMNWSLTPKLVLGSGSRQGTRGPSSHVGPSSPCPQWRMEQAEPTRISLSLTSFRLLLNFTPWTLRNEPLPGSLHPKAARMQSLLQTPSTLRGICVAAWSLML